MIEFGREIGRHLPAAEQREWLVTNGIGGFGMGTVAGTLTRRYHGLLIAALKPPLGRTLLVTKLDETAVYLEQEYPLFSNRWAEDHVEPQGYSFLERFHLDGTAPVWRYALGDALLDKRIWMEQGANTTYIQYILRRASGPVALSVKVLVNYRDYHHTTKPAAWPMEINYHPAGLQFLANERAIPFYFLSEGAAFTSQYEWYGGYFLSQENYRGQNDNKDANFFAGLAHFSLNPGETVCLVASTEREADLDGNSAFSRQQTYEKQLLSKAEKGGILKQYFRGNQAQFGPDKNKERAQDHYRKVVEEQRIRQLVLAGDQFIIRRQTAADPDGQSIIAGYPWFSDWGRDTMMALPGLTLTTGRPEVAAKILHTFSQYVDEGMLPNRFPDEGDEPEYNTADATLWFFEAIRAYYEATGDDELISRLYPILVEIIDRHIAGTRHNIGMDTDDGLIFAGEEGVQLTWMDAKVGDWVVTPRIGKPVEINALWYNALSTMIDNSERLGKPSARYRRLTGKVRKGFARFWNEQSGYCYDVLDGPNGHDASLRPNQLLAVSLPQNPLDLDKNKAIVDSCAEKLLTSFGLRSLSPDDDGYIGSYGGDQQKRDAAYHQGTVWAWLAGPFISAHLRVYGNPGLARAYLRPLLNSLIDHGLGSVSEIFDGDPPHTPRGCPAQAWSVAELLRLWKNTHPTGSDEGPNN